jgi:hypothetical protein
MSEQITTWKEDQLKGLVHYIKVDFYLLSHIAHLQWLHLRPSFQISVIGKTVGRRHNMI